MTTTPFVAGPEMDHAIATRVLGMAYEPRFDGDVAGYYRPPGIVRPFIISEEMPDYSTDLGAAAAVLDWLRERGHVVLVTISDGWCSRWIQGQSSIIREGDTPAEAICRLALAVKEQAG